ncbi:HlyD family efflux transporter periplasmic adaptor subunit [Streptomyces sp. NPDC014894]|uniref:HlyD family efflux transporter periplasmic adaptor subunit n=1 Tax=Streptomyces sp. NPDC014894 TaxID=3364931 RepID=UPI0036F6B55F
MEFRRRALARLARADEPDVPVVLAGTRTLLLLVLVTVLVAGGSVWAFAGSLPQTVHASGVLTRAAGSVTSHSPVTGRVVRAPVPEGAAFGPGAVLFTVADAEGRHAVRAVSAGRMASLLAVVGQEVTARDVLAVVEPGPADSPLEASLYLPPADAVRVRPGQRVDLAVRSVPDREYGTVRGVVRTVGTRPQSRGRLTAFLADPELAADLTSRGEPIRVTVRLVPAGTASGYRWSTPQGPPYRIDTRTHVTAAVRLPPVRPLSLVVS